MLTSCLEQQSYSSDSVDVSLELYAVPSLLEDLNLQPTKDYRFVDPENNTRFHQKNVWPKLSVLNFQWTFIIW